MHKRAVPDMRKLLKEIERWAAENSSGKERIQYMKKEIDRLGGRVKRHFTPFKHRLLLKMHREKKRRDMLEETGCMRKRRR